MFRFLKMQYQLGRVSAEKLREYCPRIITAEQYEEITGRPFAEPEPLRREPPKPQNTTF